MLTVLGVSGLGLLAGSRQVLAEDTASDEKPMRFVAVRSGEPGCEPTCPEWISAEGDIDEEAPARFKKLLREIKGRNLPLLLSVQRGDIGAAMALGRLLRRNGISVAVSRTAFKDCRPSEGNCRPNDPTGSRYAGVALVSGGRCQNECLAVLAGGVVRLAGEWPRVGPFDIADSAKGVDKRIGSYLKEMGVDPMILDLGKTSSLKGRRLGISEMQSTGLVTLIFGANLLVAPGVCKTSPAADNCRVFTTMDLPATMPQGNGGVATGPVAQPSE
nr:hypothetical protein [Mesorhizobium loti]